MRKESVYRGAGDWDSGSELKRDSRWRSCVASWESRSRRSIAGDGSLEGWKSLRCAELNRLLDENRRLKRGRGAVAGQPDSQDVLGKSDSLAAQRQSVQQVKRNRGSVSVEPAGR